MRGRCWRTGSPVSSLTSHHWHNLSHSSGDGEDGKSILLYPEWLQALSKLSVSEGYNSTIALGSGSPADFGGDLGQVTQQMVSTLQSIVRIQCVYRYMHSLSHVNILQPPPCPREGWHPGSPRGSLVALAHMSSVLGSTKMTLFWLLLFTECPHFLSF